MGEAGQEKVVVEMGAVGMVVVGKVVVEKGEGAWVKVGEVKEGVVTVVVVMVAVGMVVEGQVMGVAGMVAVGRVVEEMGEAEKEGAGMVGSVEERGGWVVDMPCRWLRRNHPRHVTTISTWEQAGCQCQL
jgi:hypothetical protein